MSNLDDFKNEGNLYTLPAFLSLILSILGIIIHFNPYTVKSKITLSYYIITLILSLCIIPCNFITYPYFMCYDIYFIACIFQICYDICFNYVLYKHVARFSRQQNNIVIGMIISTIIAGTLTAIALIIAAYGIRNNDNNLKIVTISMSMVIVILYWIWMICLTIGLRKEFNKVHTFLTNPNTYTNQDVSVYKFASNQILTINMTNCTCITISSILFIVTDVYQIGFPIFKQSS